MDQSKYSKTFIRSIIYLIIWKYEKLLDNQKRQFNFLLDLDYPSMKMMKIVT